MNSPALTGGTLKAEALDEVVTGLHETATAAGGFDDGQFQPMMFEPHEAGHYWGDDRERLVLASREKQLVKVLKEIVPAYNPFKIPKDEEGSSS